MLFIFNGQLLSCVLLIMKGDFVARDWHLLHSPGDSVEAVAHFEGLLGFREEQDKSASAGEVHEGNHRAAAEAVVPHSSGLVVVSATQEGGAEERCVRGFDTDEYNEAVALVHSVVEVMEGVRWYKAATRDHHDGLLAVVQVVKIQAGALVLQLEVVATKIVWTSAVHCGLGVPH